MKPISIYGLTRVTEPASLQKLERQLSGRSQFLTMKKWELQSLRALAQGLQSHMQGGEELEFYYSYQLPKLGKEFDLLRISAEMIINIELKSEEVSDEQILKQLLQNRYYLATLGKTMRFFTYISSQNRLIRLSKNGHLKETNWETLCEELKKQGECYEGDIEEIIKEEDYIISPLAEPERFLNHEYFLTAQQKDIAHQIVQSIRKGVLVHGICGLPGTGKTLLLYDLAMRLSKRQRVCLLHMGQVSEELKELQERLKRIEIFWGERAFTEAIEEKEHFEAIFVDEAHWISKERLEELRLQAQKQGIPLLLSYDKEEVISEQEKPDLAIGQLEEDQQIAVYHLTNRIRSNAELSSFALCLMQGSAYQHRKDYPSVAISYANEEKEVACLKSYYQKKGFTELCFDEEAHLEERVLMCIDEHFYYDKASALRYRREEQEAESFPVRQLFHGLNCAKSKLALIIFRNPQVLERILNILQG